MKKDFKSILIQIIPILAIIFIIFIGVLFFGLSMSGCNKEVEDISILTDEEQYEYVADIWNEPIEYEGKTIRMKGLFGIVYEEDRPSYGCIIFDEDGCTIPLEFIPKDTNHLPEVDSEIIVEGKFDTYEDEDGELYYALLNATVSIP